MEKINRKEFIKCLAMAIGGVAVSSLMPICRPSPDNSEIERPENRAGSLENILVDPVENAFQGELRQLVSKYTYGQLNLLENNTDILYNERAGQMLFTNFYRYDEYPTTGTCTELMGTAFKEIKSKYPNCHVIRALGNEPVYFNESSPDHYFLLVSENNLMGDNEILEDKKKIRAILEKNPLLIDPSFKKVTNFLSSNYTVRQLFGESYDFKFTNALLITEIDYERFVPYPIYLTRQREMMYMSPDIKPFFFFIGFQSAKAEQPEYYELDNSSLTDRARFDQKALLLINFFRKKEKEIILTDENLMSTYLLLK